MISKVFFQIYNAGVPCFKQDLGQKIIYSTVSTAPSYLLPVLLCRSCNFIKLDTIKVGILMRQLVV